MVFEANGKLLVDYVEWLPVIVRTVVAKDKKDAKRIFTGLTNYVVIRDGEREYKYDFDTLKIDIRTLKEVKNHEKPV